MKSLFRRLEKKTKTTRRIIFILAAVLAIGLAGSVVKVFAVHNDGIFQVDGDAKEATCGTAFADPNPNGIGCTGDDWDSLYTCTAGGGLGCTGNVPGSGNSANAISVLVVDPAPESIFTGGGSKDEKDITQWQWKDGAVPDKDDLIEAFAALYTPTSTRKIIYFGANRLAVDGDAQIGFWFLQNPVINSGTGKTASPFTDSVVGGSVHHKIGDVLILSNFVSGGGSSNIQVYVVNKITTGKCPAGSVEDKAGQGDICLTQLVNGNAGANGVCNLATTNPAVPADAACAATNGSVVDALDPDFLAKSGAGLGEYPIVGFFEGGLDLTALGLGGECFPTFVVETRSSQSITAVLKDFTIGQFERCFAEMATDILDSTGTSVKDQSVTPSTVIHDVATVTGLQGGPDPGVGGDGNCTTGTRDCTVTFNRYASTDCTGTPTTQKVNCVSDGNGTGTCTATSSNFTTALPPGYSYLATYNGDSNYPAISLPATSCEIVNVGKLDSNIATDIYEVSSVGPPVVLDGKFTDNHIDLAGAATVPVVDQATVTPATSGPTPTGTVTFTIFTNGACSGTGTTENATLDSTGKALSSVFDLGATGHSYIATYGGNSIYNPSTASRCEPVCAIDTTK